MPKSQGYPREGNYPLQVKPSNRNTFVYKLFSILSDHNYASLRWSNDGLSVVMGDPESVKREVLSKHFETDKLSSIVRQFHIYLFKRTTDGRKNKEHRGSCMWIHEYFRRGHYDDLKLIVRRSVHKSVLKGSIQLKSGICRSRQRLPESSSCALSQQLSFGGVAVSVLPCSLVPVGQGAAALSASAAPLSPPALPAISSPHRSLSAVVQSPPSPPPPPPPPPHTFQQRLPVAPEANAGQQVIALLQHQSPHIQGVFLAPHAREAMQALQTIEDNLEHVHAEVLAFVRGQLDNLCESIDGIRDRSLTERAAQATLPPVAASIKQEARPEHRRLTGPQMQQLEMLTPRSAPGLPSANMVLAFGGTSHSFSLPSSSARASLFTCSLAQRGSNFGVPAPIITTPDNMSHLLAHQGVMPRNQQEHADNNMIGPKLSPLTPLPAGTGEMFSACQTPRFGGASMSMAAAIYSAAPMSAGCHTITAAADFGDIEMACSPRTGPSLSGFSVADIYMPPVSPFGPCTSALASTTGAPTPLFMNANSFGINPLPLAAASPWPTGTAMDVSTSMSEQLRAAPPALPPGPY